MIFNKVRSFLQYPLFVRIWFVPVLVGLGGAKLLIALVSFRRLAPHLGVRTGVAPWVPVLDDDRLCRARQIFSTIDLAAGYSPYEVNCFPKAIVSRYLLAACKIPYCLYFGVRRKQKDATFDAHAWVVAGDCGIGDRRSFWRYAIVGVFAAPGLARQIIEQTSPDGSQARPVDTIDPPRHRPVDAGTR